jgi:hypothetical protein
MHWRGIVSLMQKKIEEFNVQSQVITEMLPILQSQFSVMIEDNKKYVKIIGGNKESINYDEFMGEDSDIKIRMNRKNDDSYSFTRSSIFCFTPKAKRFLAQKTLN